jgi:hypothetical protein
MLSPLFRAASHKRSYIPSSVGVLSSRRRNGMTSHGSKKVFVPFEGCRAHKSPRVPEWPSAVIPGACTFAADSRRLLLSAHHGGKGAGLLVIWLLGLVTTFGSITGVGRQYSSATLVFYVRDRSASARLNTTSITANYRRCCLILQQYATVGVRSLSLYVRCRDPTPWKGLRRHPRASCDRRFRLSCSMPGFTNSQHLASI